MKILITNDDGIGAEALPLLAEWAKRYGDVTVVAPKTEQSGKSQAIDFHREIEIKEVPLVEGVRAYAMDSTPADCVRFGILGLGEQYDLVLSGINNGYNLGHDIVYSGTVGAIFEAYRLGVKAIALSKHRTDALGPVMQGLDEVFAFIEEHGLLEKHGLYNVNIPEKSRGIRITRQGGVFYTDGFEYRGNDRYIQVGDPYQKEVLDIAYDTDAIWEKYISISPLTIERTDMNVFAALQGLKKD